MNEYGVNWRYRHNVWYIQVMESQVVINKNKFIVYVKYFMHKAHKTREMGKQTRTQLKHRMHIIQSS